MTPQTINNRAILEAVHQLGYWDFITIENALKEAEDYLARQEKKGIRNYATPTAESVHKVTEKVEKIFTACANAQRSNH